jgi:hypothetical protein
MHCAPMAPTPDSFRRRAVQALSRGLLETAVRKLEADGWRREGAVSLAKPVSDTQPPYLVQTMVRPIGSGLGA